MKTAMCGVRFGIFFDGRWNWFGGVIGVWKEHPDSVFLEMEFTEGGSIERFWKDFANENNRLYAIQLTCGSVYWFRGRIIRLPVDVNLPGRPIYIRPEIYHKEYRYIGGSKVGEMTPYEELRYNWDRNMRSYVDNYYHDVWFTSHCFEMGWW